MEHAAAGDYVPSIPSRQDVPDAWADSVLSFMSGVSHAETSEGAALGAAAIDELAGPATDGREPVDVVITHAFTIGLLLAHAMDAPTWRWFPPSQCHAGLTVIRYASDAPPAVMVANELGHLPAELQWTGFPEHLRL